MAVHNCPVHDRPTQKNGVCPSCYFREWYARNREDVLVRVLDWKRDHPDRLLESRRRWYRKRRLARYGAAIGDYADADVFARYGRKCYICEQDIDFSIRDRGPLHPAFDHVVPISRGGLDILENVRPVHSGCNSRKGRKLLSELAA